jgi:branched-chain amino acid transport system substrate-binding protein
MHSAQSYLHSLPGAMNEKFVKDWVLRYKRKPNYLEYDTVLSYEILHQAILKAKSTEVAAVRTALTGLKIDTVLGPMEMRAADHQLVRPLVIVQAVKSTVNAGRGEIVLKVVQPASLVASKVSPECKMGT